jgi:hypothetical protein
VPYVPGSGSSNSILARAAGDSPYNLVFSAFDNISDSYYYVFLLGHVNLVPLAYRQAVAYNGTTPVTIGYSASNVTESSIAQSVEQATEHSFSTNMSHGWEFSTEFGFKGPVAHANFQVAVHGEYGQETTDSRSTTNTYETAQSKSSEITDEISLTIGDHNEPPGLYRYSLFTITDLYYVLETDQNKTTVKKAYASWCARPTTYWALDYEPELGGSFRKTAPGALLAIPNPVLSDLPTPTDNNLTQIPPERAAIPVADNKSGNYTESVTVTLSSETPDATIYYTTDGTTPTTSSTVYSIPIAIPNACSLRAIAVADGMENSTVMIENYAINEEPLQTSWTITISSSRTVTDKQTWVDIVYIPGVAEGYHNYDASKLKTAGYAYIQMKGSFKGKDIIDGWVWLDIKKGANGSGTTWYYYHDYDIPSGGFYTMTIPRADPYILIPLDDFDMNFQMIWDASGKDDDKWELGQRTLTFTAVRN